MLFKNANTLLIGKVLQALPSCDSTNEWLKIHGTENGMVVFTLHQTAGRGQRGRQWVDIPDASLAVSLLLKDLQWPVQQAFLLNIAVALAVHDVVTEVTGVRFTLKWPNDVMWHDQKVAGILIENQLQGTTLQQSIVGIGLNADAAQMPGQLPDATSLRIVTGAAHPPTPFVPRLIAALQSRLTLLHQGRLDTLTTDYHRQLYHLGVVRLFEVNGQRQYGMITGVNPAGQLLVKWADGEQAAYAHRTIGWR